MRFEEYAAARWPVLFRTALLLTGDRAAAEDLAQATLVKVFASWAKVRRADSPDAYVRRMLVNEFVSDRRRTARRIASRPSPRRTSSRPTTPASGWTSGDTSWRFRHASAPSWCSGSTRT